MNSRTGKHVGVTGLYRDQIEAICRAFPGVSWNIRGDYINCWTFERADEVKKLKAKYMKQNIRECIESAKRS